MNWHVEVTTATHLMTWRFEASTAEEFRLHLNRLGKEHEVRYTDVQKVVFRRDARVGA